MKRSSIVAQQEISTKRHKGANHPVICTYDSTPLIPATLYARYKRFLGDVRLSPLAAADEDHPLTTIHVPNTGPMVGLVDHLPSPVLLSASSNPSRKYAHTLEWIRPNDGPWVGVHSAKANTFVQQLLERKLIAELGEYDENNIKREVKYGKESRVDFVLTRPTSQRQVYVEVKSVTLATEVEKTGAKVAVFPDTVSVRAQRHVQELVRVAEDLGHEAVMLFVVQRGDCEAFAPCVEKDPVYAGLVKHAVEKGGVQAVAVVCDLLVEPGEHTSDSVSVVFKGSIPVVVV